MAEEKQTFSLALTERLDGVEQALPKDFNKTRFVQNAIALINDNSNINIKYDGYIKRQKKQVEQFKKLEMKRIPDAIFVVDPKKERICIQEAHTLGIPLIGIADTNCDPEELDFVIPGNDDAIRAVKLIVAKMADAVIEANQGEAYVEEAVEVEETVEA